MLRKIFSILVAFVALFISAVQTVSSDEIELDGAEDQAYYTDDYDGPIAPLNWGMNNSVVHPDLTYRILDWLVGEYDEYSLDMSRRFAGHHMVLTTGCGTYLQCGAVMDLTTGRPVEQLPVAGAGGYQFYSNCDIFSVRPPGMAPEEVTDPVFYRLVAGDLIPLFERYPECIRYGTTLALPDTGPLPNFRLDGTTTGSVD